MKVVKTDFKIKQKKKKKFEIKKKTCSVTQIELAFWEYSLGWGEILSSGSMEGLGNSYLELRLKAWSYCRGKEIQFTGRQS